MIDLRIPPHDPRNGKPRAYASPKRFRAPPKKPGPKPRDIIKVRP